MMDVTWRLNVFVWTVNLFRPVEGTLTDAIYLIKDTGFSRWTQTKCFREREGEKQTTWVHMRLTQEQRRKHKRLNRIDGVCCVNASTKLYTQIMNIEQVYSISMFLYSLRTAQNYDNHSLAWACLFRIIIYFFCSLFVCFSLHASRYTYTSSHCNVLELELCIDGNRFCSLKWWKGGNVCVDLTWSPWTCSYWII